MKTKLAVFFGGRSVEHDVSIVTGLQAIENVNREKYEVIPVYLARSGAWYTGEKLLDVSIYQDFEKHGDGRYGAGCGVVVYARTAWRRRNAAGTVGIGGYPLYQPFGGQFGCRYG